MARDRKTEGTEVFLVFCRGGTQGTRRLSFVLRLPMEVHKQEQDQKPKFKVTVKHWRTLASWSWNAGDDVCGICRNPFDGCSPEAMYPGDDSPVVWGTCRHAFHLQCITQWLSSQTEQRCPICRQNWEFKSLDQ